jgi:hypothetical protein
MIGVQNLDACGARPGLAREAQGIAGGSGAGDASGALQPRSQTRRGARGGASAAGDIPLLALNAEWRVAHDGRL